MKFSQKLFYIFLALLAVAALLVVLGISYFLMDGKRTTDPKPIEVHSEFSTDIHPNAVFVDMVADTSGDNFPLGRPMEAGLQTYVMFGKTAYKQTIDSCKNFGRGEVDWSNFKIPPPRDATQCDDKAYFSVFSKGNVIIYQQWKNGYKKEVSRILVPGNITEMRNISLPFPEYPVSETNRLREL